jgi:hypothetical protein
LVERGKKEEIEDVRRGEIGEKGGRGKVGNDGRGANGLSEDIRVSTG